MVLIAKSWPYFVLFRLNSLSSGLQGICTGPSQVYTHKDLWHPVYPDCL